MEPKLRDERELLAEIACLEYRIRFLEARVPRHLIVNNPTAQPVDQPVAAFGFASRIHRIELTDDMIAVGLERQSHLEQDRMETMEFPGVSELDPSFLNRCGLRR